MIHPIFRYFTSCAMLALLFFLFPASVSAQAGLVGFLDEHNRSISADEYSKRRNRNDFIGIKYEMGDTVVFKLTYRIEKGKIDYGSLQILRSYLASCTGKMISTDELIVIQYNGGKIYRPDGYFFENWAEIQQTEHARLANSLDEMGKNRLIMLSKSKAELTENQDVLPWQHDVDGAAWELFFQYPNLDDSFAVVHPDGRYHVFLGEYPNELIEVVAADFLKIKRKKKRRG